MNPLNSAAFNRLRRFTIHRPSDAAGIAGKKSPGLLARIFADRDTKLHNLIPCIVLTIYSLIGGGVFYAIEKFVCKHSRLSAAREVYDNESDVFKALRNDSCIKSFQESLYFAGTVYTTIGYGTVVTCCGASRAITIIYAIVGIPLTFVTLERMGRFMAAVVNGVYLEILPHFQKLKKKIQKWWRARREVRSEEEKGVLALTMEKLDGREYNMQKRELRGGRKALPLWLASILILSWMLLMSAIIAHKEHWTLADAFYFTMVTVTTIGFGDMHQTRFDVVFWYQLLMIFGLALFSMLVNLVQRHINILTDSIAYRMRERYKERLMADNGEGGGRSGKESEFLKLAKESDPAYYRFLLSRDAKDRLATEFEAQIRMRNMRCQTDDCDTRTQSTMTREADLYQGQMVWAKRQYIQVNQAKVKAVAEPKGGRRPTTARVESDEEEFAPSPRPRMAEVATAVVAATKIDSASSRPRSQSQPPATAVKAPVWK